MNYDILTPALFAIKASQGRWYPADHLLYLSDRLVDIATGKINRLMVTMPPRHGKSELISKYTPAWYLGNYPDKRIILTSYEADFAASWGWKSRNVLNEYGKQLFGVSVNAGSSARNRWDIEGHLGGMNTAGVGGPITGKGAQLFLIDDPIKNSEEAKSKVKREKIIDWYKSTAYTRLEPGGAIIIIQTRWHEEDLAGYLLSEMKEGGDQWTIVDFPAIAEDNDILGRKVGEPLFPERYPIEELEKIKQTLGSYWWYSLYQQKPHPDGGDIFKRSWFKYFHVEDGYYVLHEPTGPRRIKANTCWILQTCDPAATEKESSDYFVLQTWAVTQNKELLLLDTFRERADTTKHETILQAQYDRWKPSFQGIENRTFGLNIIQKCKSLGLPIKPLKADTDKVSRARPVAARYEVGTVYHRQSAPWLIDFEDELVSFPNGSHDDQVDTTSYAYISIMTKTDASRFSKTITSSRRW